MFKKSALLVGLIMLFCIPALAVTDPFTGVWKINDSKSSFSDGSFSPNMSDTIDLVIEGNTMKYHSVNDTDKEKPAVAHFEALMDGKPHPYPDSTRFDQVQIRRIGPGQLEILEIKDGDVIVGAWWWLSADGKQLIRRGIGKAANGHSKEYEEYFDKQ